MKRFPLLVLLLVSLFLAGCGGSAGQYTLTVTVEGDGEMVPAVGNTDYAAGTTVELDPTAHEGWAFDHWAGPDGGDVADDRIVMDADKVITAVFTRLQYDLTVTVTPPASGRVDTLIVPPERGFAHGQTVRLIAWPSAGYAFDHWEGHLSGNDNPADILMDGAKTVTAIFVQKQYDLTITIEGSGRVFQEFLPARGYDHGTTVTLTAVPDDGWFFRQWTGDVTSTANPAEIVMNGAKAVTGVFTPPRLVAVGYNGCRVVSTDGMTWTDYTAPGGGFLYGIAYGNGRFVAVGDEGRRLVSTDGVTWTNDVSGGSHLRAIAFGNGRFVAVGDSGRRIVSTDGITWTNDMTGGIDHLSGIAYGNGRFVAVGGSGRRVISTDGVNWTDDVTGGWILNSIAYGNGHFVAVGDGGRRIVSHDGADWTDTVFDWGQFWGIAFGNDRFVAVGELGRRIVSTDGVHWTNDVMGGSWLWGIGYGNGIFVAVGDSGRRVISTDGVTWTNDISGEGGLWDVAVEVE